MLDPYQLEYLLAFAEEGTLSAAAEKLHISQPALSKAMMRLEESLGVSLFVRKKNRLELSETGRYTVECARELYRAAVEMEDRIVAYDHRLRTISIGSCAPQPMWDLVSELTNEHPGITISAGIHPIEDLKKGLFKGTYDRIVLPYPMEDESLAWEEWGQENLCFSLPLDHPLAHRKELTFKDLDGGTMIVYSDIGIWDAIHRRNMPNTEFMFIPDRTTINRISGLSAIPTFCTDKGILRNPLPPERIAVPISDPDAHVTFYIIRKKRAQK